MNHFAPKRRARIHFAGQIESFDFLVIDMHCERSLGIRWGRIKPFDSGEQVSLFGAIELRVEHGVELWCADRCLAYRVIQAHENDDIGVSLFEGKAIMVAQVCQFVLAFGVGKNGIKSEISPDQKETGYELINPGRRHSDPLRELLVRRGRVRLVRNR